MILSLVRVYFHYIFIYFHTRTILPIRIWAESFFPSTRRYLSFVNRSRKICIHFHPSFSHIINHRIFVDRFCSHITFPKKILLDLDPISIYVDRTSQRVPNAIPRSRIAWSWHNFARVRSEKEKKKPAKRKEREKERRYRYRFSGKPASRASTNLISMRRIWPPVPVLLRLRIICREIRAR